MDLREARCSLVGGMQRRGTCKGGPSIKGLNELHEAPASAAHALTRGDDERGFMVWLEI